MNQTKPTDQTHFDAILSRFDIVGNEQAELLNEIETYINKIIIPEPESESVINKSDPGSGTALISTINEKIYGIERHNGRLRKIRNTLKITF